MDSFSFSTWFFLSLDDIEKWGMPGKMGVGLESYTFFFSIALVQLPVSKKEGMSITVDLSLL